NHTHKVITSAERIIEHAVNMETGMRGYLLAGEDEFLAPYYNGEIKFEEIVDNLRKAVSDNLDQVQLLSEIKTNINDWKTDVAGPNIELRRKIGHADTMNDMAKLIQKELGKQYFDQFRSQIKTFIDKENALIRERKVKLDDTKSSVTQNLNNMRKFRQLVNHTHKVITSAERIIEHAVNMETGMRGYLLAGEDEFLAPYYNGKDKFFKEIRNLQKTVSDNTAQVKRLGAGEAIIKNWTETVLIDAVKLRKDVNSGLKTLLNIDSFVSEKKGKKYMDNFRLTMAEFIKIESDLIMEHQKSSNTAEVQIQNDLQAMSEAIAWVDHTHNVIESSMSALGAAVDMETGMRGFLLSGRENFLEPFNAGKKRFFNLVSDLKVTVEDNPAQVKLLDNIEKIMKEWNEKVVDFAVGLRRKIGDSKTMDDMAELIGQEKGKQYFDKYREQIDKFKNVEETLMFTRQEEADKVTDMSSWSVILCGIGAFMIALFFSWFAASRIIRPVNMVVEGLKDIAEGEGDLTQTIQIESNDEIGELSHWFNTFVASLRITIGELAKATKPIGETSEKLSSISSQMAASAEKMNSQATMVAASSEQISASVSTVAAATEQASSSVNNISSMTEEMSSAFSDVSESALNASENVKEMAESNARISDQINMVVSSTEEMTTSMNEITKNTVKGGQIAQNAGKRTLEINVRIEALTSASKQIGKVVGMIEDIADQTNMLALNATIEAAGAGEAGKGFAVVAGEVKELARQSADATSEISAHIEEIQSTTDGAVKGIEEIKEIITEITNINAMIASSMEEQNTTAGGISKSVAHAASNVNLVAEKSNRSSAIVTKIADVTDETARSAGEIARNIEEFRNGVSEVARSSNEAALGVNEISKNIQHIGEAAKQTATSAAQTNISSQELAEMARVLTKIVNRFKT
ncbi:CHASE3 domain-containing protein, partial [Desulfobacterales bacterium HSG16]|nr:CHASE3 domain-containing protein [Desulfobacterales bacterium HSG16]